MKPDLLRRLRWRVLYGKRVGAGTWSRSGLRFNFRTVWLIAYRTAVLSAEEKQPTNGRLAEIGLEAETAWERFTR